MILKIQNLDSFVEKLHDKYLNYKTQKRNYWADKYFKYYEKANKIAERVEKMSSKIEDKGIWGMEYHIEFTFLDDYLDFYNYLKGIPTSEIEILNPNTFYITEESNDFYQVED